MPRRALRFTAALAGLVAVAGLSACSSSAASADGTASPTAARTTSAKAGHKQALSFPAAGLKWRELPGSGGVAYANVRGDLAGKGPYEAFVKFPAGKDNPYHFHNEDLPTVVLGGTFYAVIDGKRVAYPAGSFYDLPKGLPHYSGCEKGADCLLFQYQANHFDLVPTAAEK